MATNEAWGEAIRRAWAAWEVKHGRRLTLQAVGSQVAELVGKAAPFSHPAVSAWKAGTVPDSPEVVAALVRVLEGKPERFRAALVGAIPVMQNPPAPRAGGAGRKKRGNG